MAYVALEVCCSPQGNEKYPTPTTIRIAKIFANADDLTKNFSNDIIIRAESEYIGQDVYYLLWKLDEPLNIDRCTISENRISNCGMWLPDSERIYTESELEVELVPPEIIKQRARQKAAAERAANRGNARRNVTDYTDGNDERYGDCYERRSRTSSSTSQFSTSAWSGTPWKTFA